MPDELDLFTPAGPAGSDAAWTVGQVTRRARQLVESGLKPLWIKGEITGFKRYRSGHWYFSLRDAEAQVRCVMWRLDAQRVAVPPADGLQVFVEGRPSVWEERGEFRIGVKRMIPTDVDGAWEAELRRAKRALERDGLLDPTRRRPLPAFPARVIVITSADGAALHDIVTVLERRWPATRVLHIPTRVQGDLAERQLVRSLGMVNAIEADVAIVGRGGGSREDLWAFNREAVARAVAAVRIPIVSAVGHEEDVALTDLVADHRAPTPSAAAEAITPDRPEVIRHVNRLARHLGHALQARSTLAWERLARTDDRLHTGVTRTLETHRHRLQRAAGRLDALSPLKVLERGYAVARSDTGRVLRRTEEFRPGMPVRLTVADGDVRTVVEGS